MPDQELSTLAGQQVDRRYTHLQAYIVNGEPRYDAVWEPGAKDTTSVLGWLESDFAIRFSQLLGSGYHLVHMQSYEYDGKTRRDAVWESGAADQTFVLDAAVQELVQRATIEAAAGRSLRHLQAYDAGGGRILYDAVWDRAARRTGQTRILSESIAPFAARVDRELAAGRHVGMMQAHTGR